MIAVFYSDLDTAAVFIRLQWGRDLLITELHPDKPERVRRQGLQWGRDLLITELPETV